MVLLFIYSCAAMAQAAIEDYSALPIAPRLVCADCDPSNSKDARVLKLIDEAREINFLSCQVIGMNLFHQEANDENCNRGAAFIEGSHGNLVYYFYFPYKNNSVIVTLLFYHYRPGDFTNCSQMRICRNQKMKSLRAF